MTDVVLSETLHDGQVVRLTLNAPKGNVLDSHMMDGLQTAFDKAGSRGQVKLLQITGAGNHFSFGASVAEHTCDKAPNMLKQFHRLFFTLAEMSIPTAALISGQCLGGGLELALMCNFLFADKTAKLGQPEINLGVFAPPASVILPLKIGQSRADCLLVTGRIISADEAEALGIVTRLFDTTDAMLTGVDQWTEKHILGKSASSLKYAVKAGRHQFNETVVDRLNRLEKLYTEGLMTTHDANEGIHSFLERRKPNWENR